MGSLEGLKISQFDHDKHTSFVDELLKEHGMYREARDRLDLRNPNTTLVAELDEVPAGTVQMIDGVLQGLVVMPELRSRGVGTELINAAVGMAWSQGLPYVEILVDTDRLDLGDFWEQHGFEKGFQVDGRILKREIPYDHEIFPAQPEFTPIDVANAFDIVQRALKQNPRYTLQQPETLNDILTASSVRSIHNIRVDTTPDKRAMLATPWSTISEMQGIRRWVSPQVRTPGDTLLRMHDVDRSPGRLYRPDNFYYDGWYAALTPSGITPFQIDGTTVVTNPIVSTIILGGLVDSASKYRHGKIKQV